MILAGGEPRESPPKKLETMAFVALAAAAALVTLAEAGKPGCLGAGGCGAPLVNPCIVRPALSSSFPHKCTAHTWGPAVSIESSLPKHLH